MAVPVIMPRQGQSVESCIITEFYKSVGDQVEKGEILFAYETDKASFEEESPESGTILAIFFEAGDEVPVLTNVLVIGKKGESSDEFSPNKETTTEVTQPAPETKEEEPVEKVKEKPVTTPKGSNREKSGFISPRAKNMAKEKGIDVSDISGTGPNGRIIERDIIKAIESSPKITPLAKKKAAEEGLTTTTSGSGLAGAITSGDLVTKDAATSGEYEIVPLSNMRKLIANAMHRSIQNSAQLTHHLGADARQLLKLRQLVKQHLKEGYEYNITINDMVCLSVINTLRKYPQINSHFLGNSIKTFKNVHLGLAVDTDRGLMVPTVVNADYLSIQGLSAQLKTLADSCRKGSVNPDLLSPEAASFTVSNLGNYGVEMFTPIINLPQVAILGVNTILPRPKDLGNGVFGFVPHIGLSLTYDHRAIDGGEATRFLKDLAIEIETFEFNF